MRVTLNCWWPLQDHRIFTTFGVKVKLMKSLIFRLQWRWAMAQIATGKSRKRIAEELYIDLETVKSHIKNIYHKLDVHSKADAIKAAKDNKFI